MSAEGGQEGRAAAPIIMWGIVVGLASAVLGALLLALGLLLFDELRPSTSAALAINLAAVAIGSLWASRRMARGGLWVGALTGLGYALVVWLLAALLRLGPLAPFAILQALVSAAVVGAVAGVIGVNL